MLEVLELDMEGVPIRLSALRRRGERRAAVFLHGFGLAKEDFADAELLEAFAGRELLMFDFPASGGSPSGPNPVDVPWLARVTGKALAAAGIRKPHLVGHSLGGLVALLAAHRDPGIAYSFANIEGNLAEEDCFISRRAIELRDEGPSAFAADLKSRILESPHPGSRQYVAGLGAKMDEAQMRPLLRSVVETTMREPLLDMFLGMKAPRLFMHGAHSAPSYLSKLRRGGVEIAKIANSGHFPMLSNPPAMWSALAQFMTRAEARDS